MSDEKPDGPQYISTKQIPKVEVAGNTLDAVLSEMRAMRAEQRVSTAELTEKVDTLSLNVDALQHDAKDTRLRLGRMERELDEVKDRQSNNSVRVKGESEVNLKQDAAIAAVLEKVNAIDAKPDTAAVVLAEVKKLSDKPWAKKLGAAILPVLLLAISAIGVKLQMSVSKLEEKPTTVQAAPTVYVPVPMPSFDGGAK